MNVMLSGQGCWFFCENWIICSLGTHNLYPQRALLDNGAEWRRRSASGMVWKAQGGLRCTRAD